jgi:hypothetical protein
VPHLVSDSGALRLALELLQRETVRARPGEPAPPARLLSTVALEWLDQRDAEWWPFVRLPPLWLDGEGVQALVDGLREVLQGAVPGFAWQSGETSALGLQLGAAEGGPLVVEVGLDLARFLADASGLPSRSGGELALFRFAAAPEAAVRFAGALEAQLREVLAP